MTKQIEVRTGDLSETEIVRRLSRISSKKSRIPFQEELLSRIATVKSARDLGYRDLSDMKRKHL